jgi:hypothetical protein
MLKRCYAPKIQGDKKKRVRFSDLPLKPRHSAIEDDYNSVKSTKSDKVQSKGGFFSNWGI